MLPLYKAPWPMSRYRASLGLLIGASASQFIVLSTPLIIPTTAVMRNLGSIVSDVFRISVEFREVGNSGRCCAMHDEIRR